MSETKENITVEEATENEAAETVETTSQEEAAVTAEEETAAPVPDTQAKKKSKAPLIVALCVLVAVVVGGLAFVLGSGYDKTFDPLFYTSNNALYMKDLGTGKKEAALIYTSENNDIDSDIYLSTVLYNSDLTEALISIEEKGVTSLYSYDLTDKSAVPVKILENVNSFVKNEATGIITCSVGEESRLVQLDAELKETTVAEKADYFTVSADGLSVFYSVEDGGAYLRQNGKAAVELTKNGTAEYYDDNLTLFYILEEGSLYKADATGKRTLIDKDVASTCFGKADGYYYKTVKTINIKDLFEDDMAEADNQIKIPEDTNSEAYKLYTERLTRDQVRTIIINPELNYYIQDLYYFDGTESKSILKNVYGDELSYYFTSVSDSAPATLNCSVIDTGKIKKVRMSDLWKIVNSEEASLIGGLEEVTDLIAEPLVESCTDYFVYKGDFAAEIGIKGMIHGCNLDENNNVLYVTASDSVFGDTALYKLPVIENSLGKAELVCESVNSFETTISENGKLYYIEEAYPDEDAFEAVSKVYLDSKLIAENVSSVAENNLEKGLFIIDKYHLNEDGTPDFEAYPYNTVFYNAETDKEILLNAEGEEYYYAMYETPAGKTILIESDYGYEDVASSLYSVENGKKKLIATINGNPDYFSYMSTLHDGNGYFNWEDDDFWGGDEFDFGYDF